MIVSDSHDFIYARVPKTASTSVSAALEPYRRGADRGLAGRVGRKLGLERRHHRFVDFRGHSHWGMQAARDVLPPDFFRRATKFTVVRHPFERMVSMYNHILRSAPGTPARRKFADLFEEGADLDSFVRSLAHAPLPPQSCLVIDYDGRPLVDQVARVELLEQEIAPIFDQVGAGTEIPRLNVGFYRSERNLSVQARAIIRDVYAVDFEMFGYDEKGVSAEPDLRPSSLSQKAGKMLERQGALDFSPWKRVLPQ